MATREIIENINETEQTATIQIWTEGYPEPFTTRVEPVDPEMEIDPTEHAGEWRLSDDSDADSTYYPSFEAALAAAREYVRLTIELKEEEIYSAEETDV